MTRLVLVGAGHAHAQVLLSLALRPVPELEIVLLSPEAEAPYSGMVPAWLAGEQPWAACCVDFRALCRRAGARLVLHQVEAIDPERNTLTLDDGTALDYDWLSVNIGATLHPPESKRLRIVPMRPLSMMRQQWHETLEAVAGHHHGAPFRVLMVGAGAAGIESILAVHHRLTTLAPHMDFQFTLATQGTGMAPGVAGITRRKLDRHLKRRGIVFRGGFSARTFTDSAVLDANGDSIAADVVLWATGAHAFEWPRRGGLATDAGGFICIDPTLRAVSHDNVFAAGDCASWVQPLPKAGVFAVRMGAVLAANLRAAITGRPLDGFRPQRRYLMLVGTGGRNAVASWGEFGWEGAWVHAWKKWIDRRFLARYSGSATEPGI